ncbi:fimbrial protein [Ignatzschineria rhizosphaerae]|uniref:Fimbrial protein n=1 Tax=Ignatzschineria rhizosphaerae TaxID=2923279 RepID=A0ABY3X2A7_9GAMM|nr:fimbrial protein [Ignatzschineria rhizosphaerae]UNM97014.1 fimbrial protein [Ignatzschineria rhizosphaerae]
MKKFNLLLMMLFASITVTHAQNGGSFQINGEIIPERICDIYIPSIELGTHDSQKLEKLGNSSFSVTKNIELHYCDLSLIPGGGSTAQFNLTIEPGEPSPNPQYWSTLNKPNADHLGISLRIDGQKIPPSGGEISITMYENSSQQYNITMNAQIINIAEGKIDSGQIMIPINYKASFK